MLICGSIICFICSECVVDGRKCTYVNVLIVLQDMSSWIGCLCGCRSVWWCGVWLSVRNVLWCVKGVFRGPEVHGVW